MTFDTWTSRTGDPFLSVTAHYICSSPSNPQLWELQSEQLAVTPVEGNHSGQNIGKILVEVIDKYELRNNVSTQV